MNANNTLRQRANTIGTPPRYYDDDSDDSFVICPEWGCGFEGQIFSRSLSSDSTTSSTSEGATDDSVEIDSSQLEDKHLSQALNQGVFDSVHEQNRKDRKKSFEKDHHHHHHSHHHSHHHHHHHHRNKKKSLADVTNNNDENEAPLYMRRPRSKSFENKNETNEHSHHHRRKRPSKHSKLRQELSNSGIDLHASTENLSIDEIFEMQNRFFSSLKLSPDYLKQYSHEDLAHRDAPCSPVHKNRSTSWHV